MLKRCRERFFYVAIKGFLAVGIAILVGMIRPGMAYDLRPIVIQLSPSGAGATQSVILTNSHAEPIAIEMRAYTRSQNPDGSEEREPEDQNIIISPPQFVVAPGASQSVRVRWIGPVDVEKEIPFRLVSQQLPIRLANEEREDFTADVSLTYKYEAALYVVPAGTVPEANIIRSEAVVDEDGAKWLELDISSDGSRRAILEEPKIVLSPKSGGDDFTMEGDIVRPITGLNILSGGYLTVRLPWPEDLKFEAVEAELETRYLVFQ